MSARIGVLAIQGDFDAHRKILESLGHSRVLVRTPKELEELDGIILPGGESGAHLKILKENGLYEALSRFHERGGALYGTCAGLILLARNVTGPVQDSLGLLDVDVERNGYGRQIDSFEQEASGDAAVTKGRPFRMVFIRAPRIRRVGPGVEILLANGGEPVAVRQGRVLASAFHPEIAGDDRLHRYFIEEVMER